VNRKESYIAPISLEPGVVYIVLRPRKKFLYNIRLNLEQEVNNRLGESFGLLKLYGIALNYVLTSVYRAWFPSITRGRNIYFKQKLFCSESVSKLYDSLGMNIKNYEDFAMVTPVDILNSYNLNIIGYFEKDDKN
ncbi:MAG: hypothetical protein ACOCQD_03950, partial [archaeon]